MFSEIKSFLDLIKDINKKNIVIILIGILILLMIVFIPNNVHIFIADSAYKKENTHYYKVYSDESINWDNARIKCEKVGGHLVTITSDVEQKIVSDLIGKNVYWIGALKNKSKNSWSWVTNEDFTYTNWNEGEPNNAQSKEDVIILYLSGKWNDLNSETTSVLINGTETDIYYVCEWEHKINFIIGKNKPLYSFGLF